MAPPDLELCAVRHGIAEDARAGTGDWQRALTPRGRKRMEEAASGLAELFSPRLILTSPLLRAQQTAEILAEAMEAPVERCDALANGDHESLLAACRVDRVVAVGHEPHTSRFIAWALGSPPVSLDVRKGGAALLYFPGEPEPGTATLRWFLPPRVLRKVGGRD